MGVSAAVESTLIGKIKFTEGHHAPNCRVVAFVANVNGSQQLFRIPDKENTDISAVVLAALATQSDVKIWFDAAESTGCGNEPAIKYVRIFRS